jgi:hypothetical protein
MNGKNELRLPVSKAAKQPPTGLDQTGRRRNFSSASIRR